LTQPQHANHVWRIDHKGWIRLKDGTRVEPLTMTDGFSRYLLALSAGCSTCEAEARPVFERAFADYGLPEVIRSDNGTPFASSGQTGLTQLAVWWIKLGIRHERIDPGSPQQNGGHERFHRTMLEAMLPVSTDRAEQEKRFAAFLHDYNQERPHEGLGQKIPASLYHPSSRAMPACLPKPDYPPEWAARKVRSNGEIRWRGGLVFLSTALIDEIVAVEDTDEGEWRVHFFDRLLGTIDPKTLKLRHPMPPKLAGLAANASTETQKVSPINPV
jgi:hypothetical protein